MWRLVLTDLSGSCSHTEWPDNFSLDPEACPTGGFLSKRKQWFRENTLHSTYQTEWPRKTRAYEYGVYTDQVLQNKFMPGMAVLTNLSPQ